MTASDVVPSGRLFRATPAMGEEEFKRALAALARTRFDRPGQLAFVTRAINFSSRYDRVAVVTFSILFPCGNEIRASHILASLPAHNPRVLFSPRLSRDEPRVQAVRSSNDWLTRF